MSARPQTTLVASSPWPVIAGGKKTTRKSPAVDVSTLKVMRAEPLPSGRSAVPHKYSSLFEKLEFGDAVKCQPFQVSTVSKALNKWLEEKAKPGLVRTCRHYEKDGLGRVWLLEPAKPAPKARAARKGGAA